jgi:DNA-binding MarR family transcriptional regulator
MEKAGLITRKADPRDARATKVFLADSAREIAARAFPLLEQLNGLITQGFSEEELTAVHRFIDSLINLLTREDVYE